MFNKINDMKTHHQIIFSLIIGFAVVAFWRGGWGLLDVYLFPENYLLSSWISLILGVSILIITQYISKELM